MLVSVCLVLAMVSSLGAPLIPTIGAKLHVSADTAQWTLTAALLAGTVSTPTLGRLSDGPHRRPIMLGVLAAVVLGNVLAATAGDFGLLVAGRVLQGFGIGLVPMTMTVASEHLPEAKGRGTVAILSVSAVAGVGIGYPLTGLVALHFGYRAAFWLGAMVAALTLILAVAVIPASRRERQAPFDVVGVGLLSAALLSLLLAIGQGPQWGWLVPTILGLFAAAVLLFGCWAGWELRTSHPLVDLRLLRYPWVMTADIVAVVAGIGMYLLLALTIRFVQTPGSAGYGYGASVFIGGFVILPMSVGGVLGSRLAPRFGARFGTILVIPAGCLVFAAATIFFLLEHDELWNAFVTMGLAGIGLGFSFAAMPGMIIRAVPATETGSAISVNQVMRGIGYSVGSALSAVVLSAYTARGAMFPHWSGYRTALLLGTALWIVTALISYVIPRLATANRGRLTAAEGVRMRDEDADRLAEESGETGGAGLPFRG